MLRLAFPQIPFSRFISDSEAPNLRMVSSLSTFFLCTHSLKSPTLKPLTKPHCFARFRARVRVPPKASSQNNNANNDSVETPSLQPSSPKPPYNSSSSLLRHFRYYFIKVPTYFLNLLFPFSFWYAFFFVLNFEVDFKCFFLR